MYVAGEVSASEWLASASTAPFLSDRRTVVVRNLLRVGSPGEAFSHPADALKSIPETGRLVLVADEEGSSDHRAVQRLEGLRKGWETVVAQAGGEVVAFKFDAAKTKAEVAKRAAEAGKKMSASAADLLVEMTGGSLSRALEELEKVLLFVGDAETVRESDIDTAAVASREWSVFKLADHILDGNTGQALAQLRMLVGSGAKAENAAMQNIFPNLSRNLRLIWQARVFLEAKSTFTNPTEAVRAALPEDGGILKASDWQRNRAMAAARRLNFAKLGACLEAVSRTDARLKGLEAGLSPLDSLERMVLEMVQIVKSPDRATA